MKTVRIRFGLEFECPTNSKKKREIVRRLEAIKAALEDAETFADTSHLVDTVEALEAIVSVVRRAKACNRD